MKPLRAEALHPLGVALVLFALYAASAPRAVMMEDDGSFILASYFLGVAHPPGYPLYVLFGKLATLLPFGPVAYRVHLLSGFFGAAGCAALWLCGRSLGLGKVASHVAALGLGLSTVYWSQALIAEVYTLNALLFFVLMLLALRGAPLGAMAFLFGLSLSNHWPLMLLAGTSIAVLLWPRRAEIARNLLRLVAFFILGLAPYAWMVARSHADLPISFAGPLSTFGEFWFFVSRAGYADVDVSAAAGWLDKLRYLRFLGAELLRQFAVAGTGLALLGFWLQWRRWERRIAAALTVAFVMPTVVLIVLLGFNYDAFYKHIFHVYPLPAYGIAALWMGLGMAWVGQRFTRAVALPAAGAVLLLIGVVGAYGNLLAGYRWVERYATVLLEGFPKDAVVLLNGADVPPLAYLHMIDNVRPDLTLYHPHGLVLGNRLFHPYRADAASQQAAVRDLVTRTGGPVATTAPPLPGMAWREHWLFSTLERGPASNTTAEIPPALRRFYEEALPPGGERNGYIAFFKNELRRRYAALTAQAAPADASLEGVAQDFAGALGAAEGLLARPQGYPIRQAAALLERAAQKMPADATKAQIARFFELRGYVRIAAGDRRGALSDLETSASTWPVPGNRAAAALRELKR